MQYVTKTGYHIADGVDPEREGKDASTHPALTDGYNPGARREVKSYDPLSPAYQSLYRKFAALDPNREEDLIRFANRYGLLGLERDVHRRLGYHACLVITPGGQSWGERVSEWQDAIKAMKRAVKVWDALNLPSRAEQQKELGELIKWDGDSAINYQDEDAFVPFVRKTGEHTGWNIEALNETLDCYCQYGSVIKSAVWFLQHLVNERIMGIGPRLLWMQGNKRKPQFQEFAYTLLSAMWYHLAKEIVEPDTRRHAYCVVCETKFPCQRSTARYCSGACKKKAERDARRTESDTEES